MVSAVSPFCPRSPHPGKRGTRAFTLIEVLASMVVLTLLVTAMAQLLNSATSTSTGVGKRIDADSQARLVLDRMADDFSGMAKRPDIDFYFHHQAGNDALYFFSSATGYYPAVDPNGTGVATENPFSLAGYRVSDQVSGGSRYELERLGRGMHWYDTAAGAANGTASAVVYLPAIIVDPAAGTGSYSKVLTDPYNNSSNLNPDSSSVPEWDVIGDQVFRLEFCYLLKDGTLDEIPASHANTTVTHNLGTSVTRAPTVNDDTGAGYASGSRWYDRNAEVGYVCVSATAGAAVWMPLGLQDTQAVVVAVASLDKRSRLLASAASLSQLTSALKDFSVTNTDPVTKKPYLMAASWMQTINQAGFAASVKLPPTATAAVHVYQRYFYLN